MASKVFIVKQDYVAHFGGYDLTVQHVIKAGTRVVSQGSMQDQVLVRPAGAKYGLLDDFWIPKKELKCPGKRHKNG